MERIEICFPGLRGTNYEITSEKDDGYNCIAWAAGDTSNWWWPGPYDTDYWPKGVPRNRSIEAFTKAFMSLGYEEGDDFGFEIGVEKVAIFANENLLPTHAARQLEDGTWTSKLGPEEDIMHVQLDHISGRIYGVPVRVMRRPRNTT